MFKLVVQNLLRHPLRSILTVGSVCVAVFLLCLLRSIVTTMNAGLEAASATRLVAMSSISLFVDMPLSYQDKIARVEGVEDIVKWQWFGAYYQSPDNFFGQFAVDPERMRAIYPECQVEADGWERLARTRNGCIVGYQLADQFGWKVGDKIPMIGALFPHPSGSAWEFELVGVYRSTQPNFDNRTMFFRWDFFEETLKSDGQEPGVGVFVMKVGPGADVPRILSEVEALFENGPMRVKCDTESEFTRQFMSMMGDIPMFLGWIGTGVLVAILLGAVNTMLMAGREQIHDVGILKALGFTDGDSFRVLISQSLFLCTLGGAAGVGLALLTAGFFEVVLGQFFPGYHIAPSTSVMAVVVTVLIGFAAGIVPAWRAKNMRCVEALRTGV
ncbi:MAG: ABC transporter permease [Planctomycetes bacterium]|nr:ABC transporter permease [Planctomycetota bacterium]